MENIYPPESENKINEESINWQQPEIDLQFQKDAGFPLLEMGRVYQMDEILEYLQGH